MKIALINKLLGAAFLAGTFAVSSTFAAPIYVGSWTVDQEDYTGENRAYTGQEAAAHLFGGSAADYFISTVSADVSGINHLAWVSTWGGACGGAYPCGTKVAEGFSSNPGGLYTDYGITSALVQDWAIGPQFRNYAFLANDLAAAVPEPESYVMLATGLGLMALMARRRRKVRKEI